MTNQGQIVIPEKVRRHPGADVDDAIIFVLDADGEVRPRREARSTVESIRGISGRLAEPRSWDEIDEIAHEDYVLAEYGRDE